MASLSSLTAAPLTHKSTFLGHTIIPPSNTLNLRSSTTTRFKLSAKFNLFEFLGGRGLLNGEKGLELELQRNIPNPVSDPNPDTNTPSDLKDPILPLPDASFDKELLGLTGGFPGGEKGLRKFIESNPPPPKSKPSNKDATSSSSDVGALTKSTAPELPLLMPGMIVIVKNPNNPFYMYCGIVQRITDGKAGVLFEGGVWDRMMTFRLEELERRSKGPPMKNPKSCILEPLIEQQKTD